MSRKSFLNQKLGKRFRRRQEQGKARLTFPRSPSPSHSKKGTYAGTGPPLVPYCTANPATTLGYKKASMHEG